MVERIAKKLIIVFYLLASVDALGLEVILNPYRDINYDEINVYEIDSMNIEEETLAEGGDLISNELKEIFNYLNYLENQQNDDCY